MIGLIIFVAIVACVCFALSIDIDDCPRVIRGYNCRGDGCDHSFIAVQQAKEDMREW